MSQRWHQFKHYLRYLRLAQGRHGTHSPLVYEFVEKLIWEKQTDSYRIHTEFEVLQAARDKVSQDETLIKIYDLGAGSVKGRSDERNASSILESAVLPNDWQKLLFSLANHFQPQVILELGTSLGLTTAYLAKAVPDANIMTIEASNDHLSYARTLHDNLRISNVKYGQGSFDDILPPYLAGVDILDLVFIDGNHECEATLRYFKMLLPKCNSNTILIFDDIYWSEGMTKAWEEIKQHPKVVISLDLYRWGIAFFPEHTEKQNFVIRSGISPFAK